MKMMRMMINMMILVVMKGEKDSIHDDVDDECDYDNADDDDNRL